MSAFTIEYTNIVRNVISDIGLVTDYAGVATKAIMCRALWDTGAEYSVISRPFVEKLKLPVFDAGRAYTAQGSYETSVYLLDVVLPNNMIVKDLRVADGVFQDFDFLIGMDIISLGDFSLTNLGKTKFTFRIPAQG